MKLGGKRGRQSKSRRKIKIGRETERNDMGSKEGKEEDALKQQRKWERRGKNKRKRKRIRKKEKWKSKIREIGRKKENEKK